MTTTWNRLVLALLLVGALCRPLFSEPLRLQLDPERTRISFLLPTNTHEVHGEFALESGSIQFDPQSGSASGEIRVHAVGAETGNEKRDRKMHNQVLESDKYPYFTFRAERFTSPAWPPDGDTPVELAGQLELLGVAHPVTWVGTVEIRDGKLVGTATLDLPFVDWGLRDPSVLIFRVEKVVQVGLELSGTVEAPSPGTDAE